MFPILHGVVSQGGGAWYDALLAKFPAGDDVAIYRHGVDSAASFYFYKHLYDNRYWRVQVGPSNLAAGQNIGLLSRADIVDVYKAYNDATTPAYTMSGSWTLATNANTYPFGRFRFSFATGAYIEMTLAGVTGLGAMTSPGDNLGIMLVSIDGDNTLATLLPTAQDLVNSGNLAASALVAGGGTLNPTDRCWNGKALPTNAAPLPGNRTFFNTSLAEGSHTVRITVTGYKDPASSSNHGGVFNILATGPGSRMSASGNDLGEVVQNTDTGPNSWELSYNVKPSGASAFEIFGHAGTMKYSVLPTTTEIGQSPTVLANMQKITSTGAGVSMTCTANLRHTETGSTNIGTFALTFAMKPADCLTISHTITWLVNGEIQLYPAMMALNQTYYTSYKARGSAAAPLDQGDGSYHFESNAEPVLWAWGTNQAAIMYVPDLALTVGNFTKAGSRKFFWYDNSTPATFNKSYLQRYTHQSPYNTFATNDVIQSEVNYRVHWFAGGAEDEVGGY